MSYETLLGLSSIDTLLHYPTLRGFVEMDLQCVACRVSLPFLPAGVYQLSSSQLVCQSCYESGAVRLPVLYDLLNDPLVFHVRSLIQNLSNSANDSNSLRFLYQQTQKALEMRLQELSEAFKGDTPGGETQERPVNDEKWQCPHCSYQNMQTNPICWQCRLAPTDAARQANVEMEDLPMLLTVRAQDKAVSDYWKCPKCSNLHSFSRVTCYCGYVNLELVSSSVRSIEEVSKTEIDGPRCDPQSICWICECGYEYNLNTADICTKCGKAKPAVDKTPLPTPSAGLQHEMVVCAQPPAKQGNGHPYNLRTRPA